MPKNAPKPVLTLSFLLEYLIFSIELCLCTYVSSVTIPRYIFGMLFRCGVSVKSKTKRKEDKKSCQGEKNSQIYSYSMPMHMVVMSRELCSRYVIVLYEKFQGHCQKSLAVVVSFYYKMESKSMVSNEKRVPTIINLCENILINTPFLTTTAHNTDTVTTSQILRVICQSLKPDSI